MTEAVSLRLDYCSHEAAKYAVEHWHYSHSMPTGKTVKIGVWENDVFIGCIIYSQGANNQIGSPFCLTMQEVCELTRVALNKHENPVSKIIMLAQKFLKNANPGLRLIVSYADSNQGHHGGIYQATNWIYIGEIKLDACVLFGKPVHRRTIFSRYGTNSIEWLRKNIDPCAAWVDGAGKHKYLMPLDGTMRRQIEPLRKPYPKRERGETDNAPETNRETGGASPTRSLCPVQQDETG